MTQSSCTQIDMFVLFQESTASQVNGTKRGRLYWPKGTQGSAEGQRATWLFAYVVIGSLRTWAEKESLEKGDGARKHVDLFCDFAEGQTCCCQKWKFHIHCTGLLSWPYPERPFLFGLRGENKENKRAKKHSYLGKSERTCETFGLKLDREKQQFKVSLQEIRPQGGLESCSFASAEC